MKDCNQFGQDQCGAPEEAMEKLHMADFYICTSLAAENEIRAMLKNNGIKENLMNWKENLE